jgi:hypothetical protein
MALVLTAGLAACSSILGYDEVSFEDGDGGVQYGSGGASSGGASSGGASSGGASSGGASSGGASSGGASSGGASSGGASSGGASSGGTGGGTTGDPYEAYRQQCVDKINEYRATLGLAPYQRWTAQESCVDNEAKTDSQNNKAHSAFGSCGEWAQNECPGYPSLSSTVSTCLAQMWAEGPGADFNTHGHYINMSSTQYTKVACGFFEGPNGVWAAQDFQ